MTPAAGLAATIKDRLGIKAHLKEGHDKIFQVTIDGKLLFTNNSQCGNLPCNEDVVKLIEHEKAGSGISGASGKPGHLRK